MEYEEIGNYFNPIQPLSFIYPYNLTIEQEIDSLFLYKKNKSDFVSEKRISNEIVMQIAAYYSSIYNSEYYRKDFSLDELDEMKQGQYMRIRYINYPSYEYQKDYGQFQDYQEEGKECVQYVKTDFNLMWYDSNIKGYEWLDGNDTLRLYVRPSYLYGKEWEDGIYGRSRIDESTIRHELYWIIMDIKEIKYKKRIRFEPKFVNKALTDVISIKHDDLYLIVLVGENFYFSAESKDIDIYLDKKPYATYIQNYKTSESIERIHKKAPNAVELWNN